MRHLALLALTVTVATTGRTNDAFAQTPPASIEVIATDGARLKGSYFSPGKPGPGILLLHQCNMDRKAWNGLAAALTARGIHVLTFDHRGYGDNRALPRGGGNTPDVSRDISAAFAMLAAMPGVDRAQLAAGGASCGVGWSIDLARRDPSVRALVLLSGTTTPEGLAYIKSHPALAIFGAAARDDSDALVYTGRVVKASEHPGSVLRDLPKGGHGVTMFAADPTLMPTLVEWLVGALGK